MKKLEAVIFDLDGTLVDSAPDIRNAVNLMLKDEGREPLSLDMIKSFIGDGIMPLCQRSLTASGGLPDGEIFPFVQKTIGYMRKTKADAEQIYPYVRETLNNFKESNLKIGMCTNKTEALTQKLLDELDLLKYFSFIAGGDTFPTHKPDPAHLLGVVDALAVNSSNCIYVGDGPADLLTAHRANVTCIIVTHGYTRDVDKTAGANLIANFLELPEKIESLGFNL